MRFFIKTVALGLLCVCMLAHKEPAKTTVKLTSHKGRSVYFKIKSQKLEWVNGKLNLALLSTDNKLVELNNINEQWLKDTTFRNKGVNFLMIDSNRTFIQNSRILPLIEIECAEPQKGKPVHIRAHGRIYYNKIWYTATLTYYGSLPEKKSISPTSK